MKPLAIHTVWALAAVGAFGLGLLGRGRTGGRDSASGAKAVTVASSPALSGPGSLARSGPPRASAADGQAEAKPGKRAPLKLGEIESVAREAFSDPNPVKRQLAFARLLEGMTPENAQAIRDQLSGGRASGEQWQLFQYAWGAVDGAGALAVAAKIENDDQRNGALSQALSGWASASPQQAIEWLGRLEKPEDRNRLQGSLVGGLADHDIGVATRYVLDLTASGDGGAAGFMGIVAAEQLRKEGPVSSALWAESLPNGDAKTNALERVANSYVDQDPAAAAAWAAQFAAVDYGARVIDEVGEEYA